MVKVSRYVSEGHHLDCLSPVGLTLKLCVCDQLLAPMSKQQSSSAPSSGGSVVTDTMKRGQYPFVNRSKNTGDFLFG